MKFKIFLVQVFFLCCWIPLVAQVPITFKVHLSTNTPAGDSVFLVEKYVRIVPMTKDSPTDWHTTLNLSPGYGLDYIYCRNHIWFGADELLPAGWDATRHFQTADYSTIVSDTIVQWKWWPVDGKFQSIDQSAYLQSPPDSLPSRNFQSGVYLPDWWDTTFIYNVGTTLDSIVAESNCNFVEFSPVPEITRFYPTPLIDREGNNGISEKQLKKVLEAASARNLGIFLNPFPWALNVSDTSASYHNKKWWEAYEAQWRPIILYYAQIAQIYHAKVLAFNMWPSIWWLSTAEAPIIDSLAIPLLREVRKVYNGKISVEFNPFGPDLQLYKEGDYLHFVIAPNWPYPLGSNKNPTVDEMVQNVNKGLNQLYKDSYEKWGKPVLIRSISASSYDGTVINQPDWETQLYYFPDDTTVPIDVQEQADVYEAMLRSLTQRSWIAGVYSFNYNYWNSYDKSPSVRNKPAEKVLAKWWRWIHPDLVHLSLSHSPEGGTTTPEQAAYVLRKDTSLQISAIPSQGFTFAHWEGDVDSASRMDNPLNLHMNLDKKIHAVFKNTTGIPKAKTENNARLQIYPNPASSKLRINYRIKQKSAVHLLIYSQDGRLVKSIDNGIRPAGNYSLLFALKSIGNKPLANGMYEIVLKTDTGRQTIKLLVSH